MSRGLPGEEVGYQITWLELVAAPGKEPAKPAGEQSVEVVEAAGFPEWLFFALYDAVGKDYAWDDMHEANPGEVSALLGHESTTLHLMLRCGWPQGFFLLDNRVNGICDIAYFGLVEQAMGKGLGGWLLDQAIAHAWSLGNVSKLTVNTCTLDHPSALHLYWGRGFRTVRSENRSRILKRPLKFPRD